MVVRKKFNKWDKNIQRRLLKATFPEGFMRYYVKIDPRSLTYVSFSKKQIKGWVLIFTAGGENDTNIVVNKRYQKQGVATELIEAVFKSHADISVAQHDAKTKKFFKKMKVRYPKKLTVIDWKKHESRYRKQLKEMLENISKK